jgi:hypothetical protein
MLMRASVASVNQMIRGGKVTCMVFERASQRGIFGVSALLFAAAVTIAWCPSMSAMGERPMPGYKEVAAGL